MSVDCLGFEKKTVTGEVIGEIEEASTVCNAFVAAHKINFEAGATTGSQKWTQTETTGSTADLISNNDTEVHPKSTYLTFDALDSRRKQSQGK